MEENALARRHELLLGNRRCVCLSRNTHPPPLTTRALLDPDDPQDSALLAAVRDCGPEPVWHVVSHVIRRPACDCEWRWKKLTTPGQNKGPWTPAVSVLWRTGGMSEESG